MAKLPRVLQKIFGGGASNNGVFGSAAAGTKVLSNNIATIMGLSAWSAGWSAATVSGQNLPTLEEMQGVQYVETSQLAYLLQEGVPEYDSATTYYTNSIVKKVGTYKLYGSIVDNNTGNALTDASKWVLLVDLASAAIGQMYISNTDTTLGYLQGKLVAGTNITLTRNNAGANETLTIAVSGLGTAAALNSGTSSGNVPVLGSGGRLLNSVIPSVSCRGSFRDLKIVASGLTNNSAVITADEVVLEDGSNNYLTAKAVSLTCNTAGTVGAINSLSTGTLAINTWYYLYVISNGTTTASIADPSATSPTLPGGYTYYARVGSVRTDGSGSKYLLQTLQRGKVVQYVVLASSNVPNLPAMDSGVKGDPSIPTWAAVSVSSFVPTTASSVRLFTYQSSNAVTNAAPNNQYGNYVSTTNPAPVGTPNSSSGAVSEFLLESTNIYWFSNDSGASIRCVGWEENF